MGVIGLYTLVWLHEGTHHAPLSREGHLGILPQRGAEAAPCGQISQLEVCQLLAASPQVIYPVGLNGQDKPIIPSLPEPLASGISLTAGEPIYLGIDIPSPPGEESDQRYHLLVRSLPSLWPVCISAPQIRKQYDYGGQKHPFLSSAGSV